MAPSAHGVPLGSHFSPTGMRVPAGDALAGEEEDCAEATEAAAARVKMV